MHLLICTSNESELPSLCDFILSPVVNCRCVRHSGWVNQSLQTQANALPCKRSRKQVSTSPDFATKQDLYDLDRQLIHPDMTYTYALPLHMGGRRRSSRVIQQEMMEDQNKIVDLMRKFPLGSLFQGWTAKRFPTTTSQKTTTRPTTRFSHSQGNNRWHICRQESTTNNQ